MSPTMVHTEWRSKASIGDTSQSCGGLERGRCSPSCRCPTAAGNARVEVLPSHSRPSPLNPIGAWNVIMAKRMTSSNRRTQITSAANECGWPALARYSTLAAANPVHPQAKVNQTRCPLPSTHRARGDVTSRGGSRGHRSHSWVRYRRFASNVPLLLMARVRRPRGVMQLAPRCRRSEPLHDVSPRTGRAAPVGWLFGSQDLTQSPASTEPMRSTPTC
jgi:hypothetical protein